MQTRITKVVWAAFLIGSYLLPMQALANAQELSAVTSQEETIEFYGEMVDPNLAIQLEEYASANQLDLNQEFREQPSVGIELYASNRGGVEVPGNYVYNPSLGSLHDYCSNSPDQFPAPGMNADFSGACARHDMCYERTAGSDHSGLRRCDSELLSDLQQVCRVTYGTADPRRAGCLTTAQGYHKAVVAWHFNHVWSK